MNSDPSNKIARLTIKGRSKVAAIPSRSRKLMAVLFFAAIWLYVFPYFSNLNNPNENVRLYMTAALVEDGGYEISAQRARWGWVNDCACVQENGGEFTPCDGPAEGTRRYYSVKAPLTSWLGVPGYRIARTISGGVPSKASALWWVRLFGTGIPCALFLYFFYGVLGRVTSSPRARDLSFIAFTLGSVFLGYSYLFASHATSAVAAGGGFFLLVWFANNHKQKKRIPAYQIWPLTFLAGFLVAGATALEYPCLFFSVALSVYAPFAIRPLPRLLAFGLGALIPTLLVAHFQGAAFGNPLSPGHLFVENAAYRAHHAEGLFGIGSFDWQAAFSLLFAPREGLFFGTPFFLFAFAGVGPLYRRHRLATVLIGVASALTFVAICFIGNGHWDGGWSIGPRYLVVFLPFVGVASAVGLERLLRTMPSRVGLPLQVSLLLSFGLTGTLSVLYPHVPREIDWPFANLVMPLIETGRGPHTMLELVGLTSTWALLPVLALAMVSLAWARGKFRLDTWLYAGFITIALLGLAALPEADPASAIALDAVQQLWEPQ